MNDMESAYAPPQKASQRSTLLILLLVIGMSVLLAAMAVTILFLLLWIKQRSRAERDVAIELKEILDAQPLTAQPAGVQVDITKAGEYIVNGQVIDEAGLIALLRRLAVRNPGAQRVCIRAHRDVPFRYPLTVIGICKMENLAYYCTVLEEERIDEPSPDP